MDGSPGGVKYRAPYGANNDCYHANALMIISNNVAVSIIMYPNDRFEEQSHEIKEAQEKMSEIVLAKQVQLHDYHHDDEDNGGDDVVVDKLLSFSSQSGDVMIEMTMMMMIMMKLYDARQRKESTWRDWLLGLEVYIVLKIIIILISMFIIISNTNMLVLSSSL